MRHNIKKYEEMNPDNKERFYPSYFPVMINEPLNTNFTILESPEEVRKGLVTLVSFEPEDLIAQCAGIKLNFQTLHTLQQSEKSFLHDPFFAGFLLHSCDPNARLDMSDFTLHAIKPIRWFQLITIDYDYTEANLYQGFTCACGSSNCRGWIAGYEYRIEQDKMRQV